MIASNVAIRHIRRLELGGYATLISIDDLLELARFRNVSRTERG